MSYVVTRAGATAVVGLWAATLLESKKTMNATLAEWVEQWALCGTSKIVWERFFTTTMTIQQAGEPRRTVETIVVWNGNGARMDRQG